MHLRHLAALGLVLPLSGCATLLARGATPLTIELDAPVTAQPTIEVRGDDLPVVHHARLLNVPLRRGVTYTVTASAPGYHSQTVTLERPLEPWTFADALPLAAGAFLLAVASQIRPISYPDGTSSLGMNGIFGTYGAALTVLGAGALAVDVGSGALWQPGPGELRLKLEPAP